MHANHNLNAPIEPIIDFSEFLKVNIRIGTILEATPFPEAKNPAYILKIDFGENIGIKKSSVQITVNYKTSDLIGKKVAAVLNFASRQIGPIKSEVLTLGFPDLDGNVVLFSPDLNVPRLF